MNATEVVIAALFFGGVGALALAAWRNRPWDTDGGEYRDPQGIRYGRIERKDAV